MKLVKFLGVEAEKSARMFLDLEAWAVGETRELPREVATELNKLHPGLFEITSKPKDDKPQDPKPAPPAVKE